MREFVGSAVRAGGSSAVAAAAGILTRPCCVAPALLSLTGGSAAGLGQVFATHHAAFAASSAMLLTVSLWMNIRLQAQSWNKWLAGLSTVAAFISVARGFWF
jgi:hypothetical protein